MDFNELARSRRSIRRFKPEDVSREDVIKLLKAAQAAPSGLSDSGKDIASAGQ